MRFVRLDIPVKLQMEGLLKSVCRVNVTVIMMDHVTRKRECVIVSTRQQVIIVASVCRDIMELLKQEHPVSKKYKLFMHVFLLLCTLPV